MHVSPDFADLLRSLNTGKARYLVVGGYAVILHTQPRVTQGRGVWGEPTRTNAARVWRALADFGASLSGVTATDFATPGTIFVMGVPPSRIDVITSVDALEFATAWARRVAGSYGGEPTSFLSVDDLIHNKRAVARPQDLLDVRKLESWSRTAKSPRRAPRRKRS